MNCIPNWYKKVLEVADHDFAIRLLKLNMAVKNNIYEAFHVNPPSAKFLARV